ncbi:ribosome maturation factor RimM [filamentous cyanobacterium CCP5]|nr:ribosome maturation factor RimM [filamentous cyanobacterium CCP5]
MAEIEPSEWMEVGRIVGAHGLRGELRVYPDSDFPERFLQPGRRWLRRTPQANPEPVDLIQGRYVAGKGLYVVQLRQVSDRTAAEALRQSVLLVPASDRPPLEAGEFYVADLIGLKVRIQGNPEPIGVVVDIYSAGSDLLAVETPAHREAAANPNVKNKPPVLVPFVPEIVPVVDLEGGYVEITPPAGLFEL